MPIILNSGATTLAGVTPGATGLVSLAAASQSAGRSAIDAQQADAELTAIAGLTSAADKLPYFTGSGTAAVADFSSTGRSIVAGTAAAAWAALRGFTAPTGSWTLAGYTTGASQYTVPDGIGLKITSPLANMGWLTGPSGYTMAAGYKATFGIRGRMPSTGSRIGVGFVEPSSGLAVVYYFEGTSGAAETTDGWRQTAAGVASANELSGESAGMAPGANMAFGWMQIRWTAGGQRQLWIPDEIPVDWRIPSTWRQLGVDVPMSTYLTAEGGTRVCLTGRGQQSGGSAAQFVELVHLVVETI